MTVIKDSDRKTVLERVLAEAFRPRFNAVIEAMHVEAQADLDEKHPVFVKLVSDKTTSPYIATHYNPPIWIEDVRVYLPIMVRDATIPKHRGSQQPDIHQQARFIRNLFYPNGFDVKIKSASTIAEYERTWSDYSEAYKTLSALLYSYKNREKFESDFPEIAKHLPPKIIRSNLPSVVVADVMANLAKVGIPAKAN